MIIVVLGVAVVVALWWVLRPHPAPPPNDPYAVIFNTPIHPMCRCVIVPTWHDGDDMAMAELAAQSIESFIYDN